MKRGSTKKEVLLLSFKEIRRCPEKSEEGGEKDQGADLPAGGGQEEPREDAGPG